MSTASVVLFTVKSVAKAGKVDADKSSPPAIKPAVILLRLLHICFGFIVISSIISASTYND
jgi:hypothetical protein